MMATTSKRFRLLARQTRWVLGAEVREYVNDNGERRFTATIRGWQGWFLGVWPVGRAPVERIVEKVREVRDRIDAGDDSVFEWPRNKALVPA